MRNISTYLTETASSLKLLAMTGTGASVHVVIASVAKQSLQDIQ